MNHSDFDGAALQKSDAGILMIAPPLRVLYTNPEALMIINLLKRHAPESGRGPGLPSELMHFCAAVMHALCEAHQSSRFELFQFRREVAVPNAHVTLRAIGMPKPGMVLHSFACILLQVIRREVDLSGGQFTRSTCHV